MRNIRLTVVAGVSGVGALAAVSTPMMLRAYYLVRSREHYARELDRHLAPPGA